MGFPVLRKQMSLIGCDLCNYSEKACSLSETRSGMHIMHEIRNEKPVSSHNWQHLAVIQCLRHRNRKNRNSKSSSGTKENLRLDWTTWDFVMLFGSRKSHLFYVSYRKINTLPQCLTSGKRSRVWCLTPVISHLVERFTPVIPHLWGQQEDNRKCKASLVYWWVLG